MFTRDFIKTLEEDKSARMRLAELLVSEPQMRLVMLNAILKEVATKQDVKELGEKIENVRSELDSKIEGVRKEIKQDFGGLLLL